MKKKHNSIMYCHTLQIRSMLPLFHVYLYIYIIIIIFYKKCHKLDLNISGNSQHSIKTVQEMK